MKKILALTAGLITGAALMSAAAPALAQVDVGVNVRLPGVYVAPAPVYVQPRPVYVQPQPVYVEPRPVYVEPRPVYIEPEREGEWHERRLRAREWRENEARREHYDHDGRRDN